MERIGKAESKSDEYQEVCTSLVEPHIMDLQLLWIFKTRGRNGWERTGRFPEHITSMIHDTCYLLLE